MNIRKIPDYRRFMSEFWNVFSRLSYNDKMKLINIWFDKVKEDFDKEENFKLSTQMKLEYFSLYFLYKDDRDWLKKTVDSYKFKKYFWNRFALTSQKWKNKLLKLWFEKVKKDFEEYEALYGWHRFDLYLQNIDISWWFKRINDEKKFKETFWKRFIFSSKKDKEKLLDIWFDKVKEDFDNNEFNYCWAYFNKYLWYYDEEVANWNNNFIYFKYKNIEEYSKFEEFFWEMFHESSNKIQKELINFSFEVVKEDFEKNKILYELNWFWDYLNYKKDDLFLNRFFDEKKFIEMFEDRYNSLSYKNESTLLDIWFDKVSKDFKENNCFYYWNWFDFYFIYKDDPNWLIRFIENKKFVWRFWWKFSWSDEEQKKELFDIWFENVVNDIERNKNFLLWKWFSVYLNFRWKEEQLGHYANEYLFSNEFWNKFARLTVKDKNELMNIWLNEIKKDLKNNSIIRKLFNSWYINLSDYLLFKKWKLDLKEKEFVAEYWIEFSSIKKEKRKELIEIWFLNVKKELESKNFLKKAFLLNGFNSYLYFRNKNEEEFNEYLETKKFSQEFWNSFSLFKRKKELLVIWFETALKEIKEKSKISKKFEESLEFYLDNRNKSEEEIKLLDKSIEISKITSRFKNMSKKFKEILLNECSLDEIKYWSNLNNFEVYSLSWLILNKLWFCIEEDWCIVHEKCSHKEKFTWAIFQRIKRWSTINCTACYKLWWRWTSNQEKEILEFIRWIYDWEIQENVCLLKNENWIRKREIDIFLPNKNFWIEYNWIYWHSISRWNDLTSYKLRESENLWIRLFVIWEDQWNLKQEVIKHKIKEHLWLLDEINIDDNEFLIKDIEEAESNSFLNSYHINWEYNSWIHLWCFYKQELIWVFVIENANELKQTFEIVRFSTKYSNFKTIWEKFLDYLNKYCKNIRKIFIKSNNQENEHYKYIELWFELISENFDWNIIYISSWKRKLIIEDWEDYSYMINDSWYKLYDLFL